MIKLLLGGSPCTHWSIAQKNGRETKPEGLGWELFKNYLIAKEKFKPDYFLYENNKSASQAIKDQIAKELGVDIMHINSALVSAQNRQRFYAFNWEVDQPEDRGIVLRDILESSCAEKEYAFRVPEYGVADKSRPVTASYAYKGSGEGSLVSEAFPDNPNKQVRDYVAEPVRIGDIGSTAQAHRVYSCDGKSVCLKAQAGGQGAKTGLYATPVCHTIPQEVRVRKYTCDIEKFQTLLRESKLNSRLTNKGISVALKKSQTEVEHWFRTDKYFNIPDEDIWFDLKKLLNIKTTEFDNFVTVFEVREGVFEKADRCYDVNGKMSTLMTGKTDNIIEPINTTEDGKSQTIKAQYSFTSIPNICCYNSTYGATGVATMTDRPVSEQFTGEGKDRNAMKRVYEVKDGLITIKNKQYPIKLDDGHYIIRKLTPIECERLQTLPDNYTAAVSNAQRYKGLGNGWTAEVIIHILNGVLKDVPRDEEIVVLSMYDGIGTGRYCLDKMGFTNVRYYAYEIDKYAKQVAMSNYPDIIQMGDAFNLRHPDWTIGY